jgi:hypothetical protein
MAIGVLTLLPGAEPRAGRPVALLPMHYAGVFGEAGGAWCGLEVVTVRERTIQSVIRATRPSGPAGTARPDPRCDLREPAGAAHPHRRRQEDPRVLIALGRRWEYRGKLGGARVYRRFRTLSTRPGSAPAIDLGAVRLVPDDRSALRFQETGREPRT